MTITAQRHVFIAALVARKIAGRGKHPDDAVKIELFDSKEELILGMGTESSSSTTTCIRMMIGRTTPGTAMGTIGITPGVAIPA